MDFAQVILSRLCKMSFTVKPAMALKFIKEHTLHSTFCSQLGAFRQYCSKLRGWCCLVQTMICTCVFMIRMCSLTTRSETQHGDVRVSDDGDGGLWVSVCLRCVVCEWYHLFAVDSFILSLFFSFSLPKWSASVLYLPFPVPSTSFHSVHSRAT